MKNSVKTPPRPCRKILYRGTRLTALEHIKFEIAPCCVVEDEAGKEGEAGNLIWFPMQPVAASRRRKQQQAQSQV